MLVLLCQSQPKTRAIWAKLKRKNTLLFVKSHTHSVYTFSFYFTLKWTFLCKCNHNRLCFCSENMSMVCILIFSKQKHKFTFTTEMLTFDGLLTFWIAKSTALWQNEPSKKQIIVHAVWHCRNPWPWVSRQVNVNKMHSCMCWISLNIDKKRDRSKKTASEGSAECDDI